ncbi:MAG: hypothetical protein BroJett018_05950 [Chloroflexota bacterium]|nr:MAG: hypothetical protein BroJett018_05950 [Chloroflexota bacterium]
MDIVHHLVDEIFSEAFEIFNTSGNPLLAGVKWRDEIRDALDKAQVVLVIITPKSASRDWVLFEAGAAWLDAENKKKRLIPCRYNIDKFPSPLSDYQGVELNKKESLETLIDFLKMASNLNPSEAIISDSLTKYFDSLSQLTTIELQKLPKTLSEDTEKFIQVIINFFSNPSEAMHFARILKNHKLIEEDAYEIILNSLVKQRYSG